MSSLITLAPNMDHSIFELLWNLLCYGLSARGKETRREYVAQPMVKYSFDEDVRKWTAASSKASALLRSNPNQTP